MSTPSDTIAAIATAPGRGAVGMLRLSGPQALDIATRLAGPLPPPRLAALRHFRDAGGNALDQGLVLVFPGPNSFTGEDVVELQGHGGPVVLDLLLRACCACGARVARPGEFSERAFLNERMDLAQAEAIADLINAATAQAARAAQRSLDGALSQQVSAITEELIALRVFVEGALDFSDEDVDWLADAQLHTRLETLALHLDALLAQAAQGRRLREGLTIALTGQPNVGKSTLMNRLAGAEVAIVTDIAGTTRDVLRENLDLAGLPVTLVDTAGLRDSEDVVEREGIRRARAALEQAELALYLVDDRSGTDDTDARLLAGLPAGLPVWVLHNKCDLSGRAAQRFERDGRVHLRIAAAGGDGLELLLAEIRRFAGLGAGEATFSARTRHVDALQRARGLLRDAQQRLAEGATPELAAEELRLAQEAMGEITGRFGSEDLLGRIFSSFCIGK
ncbi:MAG TPA: tRNA uridine-5-carboxymethylaminomethyl(34) synthesis GTPase MnmE [Solimonas sp.]|nr:tRNA uridine-5-carboxymethylaminomethyl(34) synthesis GTPase MnmE [Solimonas sp.]